MARINQENVKTTLIVLCFVGILAVIIYYLNNTNNNSSEPIKDWLGYTYDLENKGNEFKSNTEKIKSSSEWAVPEKSFKIEIGELKEIKLMDGKTWEDYPESLKILNEANLSENYKKYLRNKNYVPRQINYYDVTGDNKKDIIVLSLPLGCGSCVDFNYTIFSNKGIFNFNSYQGGIFKTKDNKGFYLVNNFSGPYESKITISKYKWYNTYFKEDLRKEIIAVPKTAKEDSNKIYTNYRFRYSLLYPNNWKPMSESENHDGMTLYKDSEGNEVVVYGTNSPSGFSTQGNHILREVITLNDGTKATFLKVKPDKDTKIFIIVTTPNEQQFVLMASGTDDFIDKNEALIRDIGKTLKIEPKDLNEKN